MQAMKNTFKIIYWTRKKLQQDKGLYCGLELSSFRINLLSLYREHSEKAGTHNPEWATPLCPCNGVFTDQLIFRLISPRILIIK